MNVFATVVLSSNRSCVDAFLQVRNLPLIDKEKGREVYAKLSDDGWVVMIWYAPEARDRAIVYLEEHYEVLKIFHIDSSNALDMIDVQEGDVMIPNTFLNEAGQAVFLESLVEKNYDLHQFGLVMNGICLTLESEDHEQKYWEERDEYIAEITDKEGFFIAKAFQERDWIKDAVMIRVVGTDPLYVRNAIGVLDVMV